MLRNAAGRQSSWLVVAAVLALLVFSGIALCACESHGSEEVQTVVLEAPAESSDDATSENIEAESDAESEVPEPIQIESSTTVENESESETAAQEQPAAEEQLAGGSTIINLDDPTQYQQINMFLSNFSEVYMYDNPFVSASASDQALCGFAMWHTYRNSPDLVEHGDYYNGGTYNYNIRITQDRANELAQRYFARSINFDNATDTSQPFYCADGYVYNETTNGAGLPDGITLARSATDLGDGTVRIDFDIYFNCTNYDTGDASLYASTPDEIKARWGVDGPARTGSAVVRYGEYNDYTQGLLLVSWEADRVQ